MINLTDLNYVKGLQSNARSLFESPAGKEVMKFLEQACGWYQSPLIPGDRQMTDVGVGRREVLATIKTLLEFKAEDIVKLTKDKEEGI